MLKNIENINFLNKAILCRKQIIIPGNEKLDILL